MRSFHLLLLPFSFSLLLPLPSAVADPAKSHANAPPSFKFFNLWRSAWLQPRAHVLQPGVRAAPAPRHSATTACLPPQLKAALVGVQARFGSVTVISTHRKGARIRGGQPSLHASCRAVDFRPAPGTYGRVAAYLRSTWNGGVGTYKSGHIHIDVGEKYRWSH